MASIKVNSTSMREKANTFRGVATSVKTCTDEMTQQVESLRSTWEGEAGETAVTKFKELSGKFEELYKTINQYASFLDEAAEAYDKSHSEVVSAAEGQQS